MKSAVLFLVFNRPDTTRQVFEAIRAARPPRLYVAADGPRPDREGEREKCREVREIATAVDWPCEVKTLFREENLGCKMGVSSGITWFFDNEEEGIILEDDVLPVPGFFPFCDELLERYRNDERVAMISGNNNIAPDTQIEQSYFFTVHNLIWGWATWRRSWKKYDVSMSDWPQWRDDNGLESVSSSGPFIVYWTKILDKTHAGLINTWDYQWAFACWKSNGLTVLSSRNLTDNLGFRPDATHTAHEVPDYILVSPPQDIDFPLIHPSAMEINKVFDEIIQRKRFVEPPYWRLHVIVRRYSLLRQLYQWFKKSRNRV